MRRIVRRLARLLAPERCGPRSFRVAGRCVEVSVGRVTLFIVGYILSPFTFWNDAFVNIPIAYAAALLAALLAGPQVFPAVFFAAYLATNVAGLLMMHVAVRGFRLGWRNVAEMVVAATGYTALATLLAENGLRLP